MARIDTQLIIEGVNNTRQAFGEVEGDLKGFSSLAKKAGVALAGALSVGVLVDFIDGAAEVGNEIQRLADISDTSAENFQRLAYGAKSLGIEQEGLADIFKDVQEKVGEFVSVGGGPLADFFDNIAPKVGVTAESFAGLGGPEALGLYYESLEKANLSQSEMTFYLEAIASGSSALLPLLKNGGKGFKDLAAEAEKLGLILSNETVAAGDLVAANLDTLGTVGQAAGNQLAAELLPTISSMTTLLADARAETTLISDAASVLGGVFKVLATAVIIVGASFKTAGRLLASFAVALTQVASGDLEGAMETLKEAANDYEEVTKGAIKSINDLWSGAAAAAGKAAAELKTETDKSKAVVAEMAKGFDESYKSISDSGKKYLAELIGYQKSANSDLEKLQSERLDIEKRYSDAINNLRNGGAEKAPTYGLAQDLKLSASNALRNGDTQKAKDDAEAALQVLEDLAAAGENTYGFAGFAKGLQDIALAANDIEQSNAQDKISSLGTEVEAFKAMLDAVSSVDIKLVLSDETKAKLIADMQALALAIGDSTVIQPKIVLPEPSVPGDPNTTVVPKNPGLANGSNSAPPGMTWVGERGPELVQFDGGERVYNAGASRNLMSRMQGLQLPDVGLGSMAKSAMSIPDRSEPEPFGTVHLDLNGKRVSMQAGRDAFDELHLLALKNGRTNR